MGSTSIITNTPEEYIITNNKSTLITALRRSALLITPVAAINPNTGNYYTDIFSGEAL